jgi:hypothetical protein
MPPKRHSARCSEADTQPRFAAVGPAPPTRITGRRRRGRPYNQAASIVARISESSTAQYLSVVAMLWCPSSCIHDPDGLRAWLLNNCCRRRRSSSTRPASARIVSSRAVAPGFPPAPRSSGLADQCKSDLEDRRRAARAISAQSVRRCHLAFYDAAVSAGSTDV